MGRRVEFDIALEPLLNDVLSDPAAELARDDLFDDVLSVILGYFCFYTVLSPLKISTPIIISLLINYCYLFYES